MSRRQALAVTIFLLIAVQVALFATSAFAGGDAHQREVKLGQDAAKDVEKERKVITDPKYTERVERLGKSLAQVANESPVSASYGTSDGAKFDYTFKVVDDPSVNAFSLPGGFIYVNKGLLDYVQSDHELAAVLAHEVAHSAHHHMVNLLKQQSRMDEQIALVLLAGLVGHMKGDELSNLVIGSELVRVARTNGYGQKAESDADTTGVTYMAKAGYNPVGMLTFLERLAHEDPGASGLDMGILQDHPIARDRCRSVIAQLKGLGIPIQRRTVTNSSKAVIAVKTIKGQSITEVMLDGKVLLAVAPMGNSLTSKARAEYVADRINWFLDSNPQLRAISVSEDGKRVVASGETVMAVTDGDCKLCGKAAPDVTANAVEALKHEIWQESIDTIY